MTGKTHKAIGVCVGVAFTYWGIKTYGDPLLAVCTIASAAGAMLPDIDHNNSKLGSRRKQLVSAVSKFIPLLVGLVVLTLCVGLVLSKAYLQMVIVLLLVILPVIVLSVAAQTAFFKRALKFMSKHRGIMHTLAIPLLLYLGFMILPNHAVRFVLLSMAAGYLSHLALDCLNKTGCPIFWPLYAKNISLLPIKTGSKAEYVVSYTLAGILLLVFAGTMYLGDGLLPSFSNPSPLITEMKTVLLCQDESAKAYTDALEAILNYTRVPTATRLADAEKACQNAISTLETLEIPVVSENKDFSNQLADYKAGYITNLTSLSYYLRHAPALNAELTQRLQRDQQAESAIRALSYYNVNEVLADASDKELGDFKEQFLPGLSLFKGLSLTWQQDKKSIQEKTDRLYLEIEQAMAVFAQYTASEYANLLRHPDTYRDYLLENGFSETEAEERINVIREAMAAEPIR